MLWKVDFDGRCLRLGRRDWEIYVCYNGKATEFSSLKGIYEVDGLGGALEKLLIRVFEDNEITTSGYNVIYSEGVRVEVPFLIWNRFGYVDVVKGLEVDFGDAVASIKEDVAILKVGGGKFVEYGIDGKELVGNIVEKSGLLVPPERLRFKARGDKFFVESESGNEVLVLDVSGIKWWYKFVVGPGDLDTKKFVEWLLYVVDKYGDSGVLEDVWLNIGKFKFYLYDPIVAEFNYKGVEITVAEEYVSIRKEGEIELFGLINSERTREYLDEIRKSVEEIAKTKGGTKATNGFI